MLTAIAPGTTGVPVSRFRPDIEGLRALAVLGVALWHADVSGIPGGFTGVDVFYVLSGYLITGLLLEEYESSAHISLVNFYARRARRLLPASALMLTLTLLACTLLVAPQELYVAAGSGRAAALYVSNIWFAGVGATYFAQAGPGSPFVHTWSLAVEEQFYFVWPVLLLVSLRFGKSRRTVAVVLAALTVASFAACLFLSYKSPKVAFYHSPLRAWQFGMGALAVMIPKESTRFSRKFHAVAGWVGLAGVLGCFFLLTHVDYPGWRGLLPAGATALLLVSGAPAILSAAPLQWLGKLSYSWYLWHWPMLSLSEAVVRPLTATHKLGAVTAALLIAAVTHRFIENPVRFSRFLSARPLLTLALAAAVTVFSFGLATATRSYSQLLGSEPRLAAFARAAKDVATPPARCIPATRSSRLAPCSFGPAGAARHIVLFGDSHAMQWFPPVEQIAASHGWKLTPLVRPGCPSTNSRRDRSWLEDVCAVWRDQALSWIAANRPDLVIVSNIAPTGGPRGFHVQDRTLRIYREGLRSTLLQLASIGTQVIVIRDSPHEYFDVPSCLARSVRTQLFASEECRMTRDALHTDFLKADQDATAGLQNVQYVDFSSEYCPGDYCDVQRGDMLLYRDRQHFTRRYALTLTSKIEPKLVRVLGL